MIHGQHSNEFSRHARQKTFCKASVLSLFDGAAYVGCLQLGPMATVDSLVRFAPFNGESNYLFGSHCGPMPIFNRHLSFRDIGCANLLSSSGQVRTFLK